MKKYTIYGNPEAENCIIRLTGEHEKEQINSEIAEISKSCNEDDWCIVAIMVNRWEEDLVPWKSQAITIDENGAGEGETPEAGAAETLKYIMDVVLGEIESRYPIPTRKYYITGYSLAGLFVLWSTYQTDIFEGFAAVSPSVWYSGWMDYIGTHKNKSKSAYLSLGSKEHKTRSKMMSCVRDNINSQYDCLTKNGVYTVLEINEGNHFSNPQLRMAKGIIWMLNRTVSRSV